MKLVHITEKQLETLRGLGMSLNEFDLEKHDKNNESLSKKQNSQLEEVLDLIKYLGKTVYWFNEHRTNMYDSKGVYKIIIEKDRVYIDGIPFNSKVYLNEKEVLEINKEQVDKRKKMEQDRRIMGNARNEMKYKKIPINVLLDNFLITHERYTELKKQGIESLSLEG